MKESYIPSAEEIKKAEDSMYTEEKKMSKMREDAIAIIGDELFQDLKDGKFDLKISSGIHEKIDDIALHKDEHTGKGAFLTGKIGDHEIEILIVGRGDGITPYVYGELDGQTIDSQLATDLFKKYYDVASLQNDEIFEDRAVDEIVDQLIKGGHVVIG